MKLQILSTGIIRCARKRDILRVEAGNMEKMSHLIAQQARKVQWGVFTDGNRFRNVNVKKNIVPKGNLQVHGTHKKHAHADQQKVKVTEKGFLKFYWKRAVFKMN